jgi:predicted dehydrogenase
MTMCAIVIGTGWAGEGHVRGLQEAGVEVVALCGRSAEPAHALARRCGIPEVRLDWHQALAELRPDLVSIATTAGPHRDMALAAAEAGCHVVCEKPLAPTVHEAREMLAAVERAGVKHAYAATGCYAAPYLHARDLLAAGTIGQVWEVDYRMKGVALPPTLPHAWLHQRREGGGLLNGFFTHQLQQVLLMTGGTIIAAMGTTSCRLEAAPVGPDIHDFRQIWAAALTPEQAQGAERRPVDMELGYDLLLRLSLPAGHTAMARFTLIEGSHSQHPNYVAVHGSAGTLLLSAVPGALWPEAAMQRFDAASGRWEDVAIAPAGGAALPPAEDADQRQWNRFFADVAADIQGQGPGGYPTFREGWMAVEVMDIARDGRSWTALPQHTGSTKAVSTELDGRMS